jgi:transcriptional regulator with XRE-family HTH domain
VKATKTIYGLELRRLRRELGVPISQVAEAFGKSTPWLIAIERGRFGVTEERAAQIVGVLQELAAIAKCAGEARRAVRVP